MASLRQSADRWLAKEKSFQGGGPEIAPEPILPSLSPDALSREPSHDQDVLHRRGHCRDRPARLSPAAAPAERSAPRLSAPLYGPPLRDRSRLRSSVRRRAAIESRCFATRRPGSTDLISSRLLWQPRLRRISEPAPQPAFGPSGDDPPCILVLRPNACPLQFDGPHECLTMTALDRW